MKYNVMDATAAHNDLNTLRPAAKLNFKSLFDSFGPIRVYLKWSKVFPIGFVTAAQGEGHIVIAMPGSEFLQPVAHYIVQDLWTSDESVTSFNIITPSLEFIPIAKALQAIGKPVTFVSCQNAPTITREGIRHRWLSQVV